MTNDLREGDRVRWGDSTGTVVKTTQDAIHVFWDKTQLTGILYLAGSAQYLQKFDERMRNVND